MKRKEEKNNISIAIGTVDFHCIIAVLHTIKPNSHPCRGAG
jgi:hypothetical protein